MAAGKSDLSSARVDCQTLAMSFNESDSYETFASWKQQ